MLVKKDKNKTAQCKFKPLNFHFLDLIPYLLRQALLYIILHSIMMFGSVFYTGGLSELLQMHDINADTKQRQKKFRKFLFKFSTKICTLPVIMHMWEVAYLLHMLAHQEEVIPVPSCDCMVHNGARG
jgi:hypothetical protein